MSFVHISYQLPEFKKYLRADDVKSCVKDMLKAKKGGKVLFKFFDKAMKKAIWQNDETFKKLLDGCVEKMGKLDKKYREKFAAPHKIFNEKIQALANEKEQAAANARAAREQEAARAANAHPTEKRHLATLGEKVKEAQKVAFDRLVACFLKEGCKAVSNEAENGVASPEEKEKARRLFNVSAEEPLAKTYRALQLVAHPDKWASDDAVAETADKFTKFLNHYRDNAA